MSYELIPIGIVIVLNVLGWVYAYGKFVGRVNGLLKQLHDPPCDDLIKLRDTIDEKLEVITSEIIDIRERLVRIETKLENKR